MQLPAHKDAERLGLYSQGLLQECILVEHPVNNRQTEEEAKHPDCHLLRVRDKSGPLARTTLRPRSTSTGARHNNSPRNNWHAHPDSDHRHQGWWWCLCACVCVWRGRGEEEGRRAREKGADKDDDMDGRH